MIKQGDFEKFKASLSQFHILTNADLDLAKEFLEPLKLKKKEHFISFNQKITHLGFITKGIFRSYYINEKGNEITTCFCNVNEFIYVLLSSLHPDNSPIAIQAIEPSEMLILSFADLNKLYSLSSNWLAFTNHLIRMDISESFNFSMKISEKEAFDKYNNFMKSKPDLINRVPMKYLASYLGISFETLSRVRKKYTG